MTISKGASRSKAGKRLNQHGFKAPIQSYYQSPRHMFYHWQLALLGRNTTLLPNTGDIAVFILERIESIGKCSSKNITKY